MVKPIEQKIKGANPSDLGLEHAYDKLCAWFFAYPYEGISLTKLSKNLDVAKSTTTLIVSALEKEGFLKKEILGNVWRIQANPKHSYFMTKKIPFNLRLIYESGIIAWVTENISDFRAIVLFGSYRKGEDMPTSDIDVAIEIIGNKQFEIIERMIPVLGYRKNVPVHFHLFSRKNIDINLFANIANGIVLQGFLEAYPNAS